MTKQIKQLVRLGNPYLTDYIFNECDIILKEQRKINVQINLRKACNMLRGKQITKKIILEFIDAINKIPFNETLKIKEFKQNIYEIYTIYNDYYTDDGIRKY